MAVLEVFRRNALGAAAFGTYGAHPRELGLGLAATARGLSTLAQPRSAPTAAPAMPAFAMRQAMPGCNHRTPPSHLTLALHPCPPLPQAPSGSAWASTASSAPPVRAAFCFAKQLLKRAALCFTTRRCPCCSSAVPAARLPRCARPNLHGPPCSQPARLSLPPNPARHLLPGRAQGPGGADRPVWCGLRWLHGEALPRSSALPRGAGSHRCRPARHSAVQRGRGLSGALLCCRPSCTLPPRALQVVSSVINLALPFVSGMQLLP